MASSSFELPCRGWHASSSLFRCIVSLVKYSYESSDWFEKKSLAAEKVVPHEHLFPFFRTAIIGVTDIQAPMRKETCIRIFFACEKARRFSAFVNEDVGRRSFEFLEHGADVVFAEERMRAVIQKHHLSSGNGEFHIGVGGRKYPVGMVENIDLEDLVESLEKKKGIRAPAENGAAVSRACGRNVVLYHLFGAVIDRSFPVAVGGEIIECDKSVGR